MCCTWVGGLANQAGQGELLGWVWSHVPSLVMVVPRYDFVLASRLQDVETTKADLKSKAIISKKHVLKVGPYE